MSVTNPASTQAASTHPGEPSSADMGATFLNTPEPIMAATTIITAE